jgi:hypothetical protein
MPDNDDEGLAGFEEMSWKLMEQGLAVRLGWSKNTHGGAFIGMDPEDLTEEQWQLISQ